MKEHKVEIHMTAHGRGQVLLDGQPVQAVSVAVLAGAGKTNRVVLVLNAAKVEVTGLFNVTHKEK